LEKCPEGKDKGSGILIQDIYGVLSDDQKGVRGSTSSNMGKVQKVTLWVNTHTHGESTLTFLYDKSRDKVMVVGNIPKDWETHLNTENEKERLMAEQTRRSTGMTRLGDLI
jgi:hypothetical protein